MTVSNNGHSFIMQKILQNLENEKNKIIKQTESANKRLRYEVKAII
jgi:hypothetical protein